MWQYGSASDPPVEPASLWYAELTGVSWSAADLITIDGQLVDVMLDNPSLATVMQGIFGANTSGGWMTTSSNAVYLWVYQVDEPAPAVVNVGTGIPIELFWTQGAQDLDYTCWETTINIADPPNTNPQEITIDEASFSLEYNVSGASFDNAGIATVLANVFHQSFGANAVLTITDVGGGDYLIQIANTLIVPLLIITTAAESGNFTEIPCP